MDIATVVNLVVAVTGLVAAVTALIHTVKTRGKLNRYLNGGPSRR